MGGFDVVAQAHYIIHVSGIVGSQNFLLNIRLNTPSHSDSKFINKGDLFIGWPSG